MPLGAEQTMQSELNTTLLALSAEVQSLRQEVSELRRAGRKSAELFDEVGPIGKEVMAGAIETLDTLQSKGYFAFGSELVGVLDRVVLSYSPDDVRQLGDNVVTILDTVRSLTQPEVLAFAQRAGDAMQGDDRKGPVGMWEMLKASRDRDVQHGVALLIGVVRQVGRTARTRKMAARTELTHPGHKKVAHRLAPSRPPRERRPAPATTAAVAPAPAAAQTAPLPAAFAQLPLDANGHLADAALWTREFAQAVANVEGVGALDDDHWRIIEYAREDFAATGKAPNVRRVANGSGLGIKGVYVRFPRKPGVVVSRVAGIPKPVGCI